MTAHPPRVLLATCAAFPQGDEDEGELREACACLGIDATWAVWDDPTVDWAAADLVVVRSTWDYVPRRPVFLAWAGGIPRLANPVVALAWSSDKRYLLELAARGVPVVPTTVIADGGTLVMGGEADVVVKPSVGAGSVGAGRFSPRDPTATIRAGAHIAELHIHGRTAIVQPYLEQVDTEGETALLFFDGRFSHAVRKGPMLPDAVVHTVGGPTPQELFVPEEITPRVPSPAELRVAEQALAAIPWPEPFLYARVDLLPSPQGPLVNEVELVEPSLFLRHAPGSVDRLAAAIARHARWLPPPEA